VQAAFAALAARKLAPGGYLHSATDWDDYARQMLEVLSGSPEFARAQSTAARPETKFEIRGLKLGHKVHDLLFRRR
jgi:tRNA (guanine-N7-)-methyltransferase